MTASWRPAADLLAADLQDVFSERLRSLVAYGPLVEGDASAPLTCLALVSSLVLDDLAACAKLSTRWERSNIATPLILPDAEFRRSLDAFPLEYGEIIRTHQRVFGDNLFVDVVIAPDDLRRACETQIKSHLVHLREAFIESGGQPGAVAKLVAASAPAFTALLRNVARLAGVHTSDRAEDTHLGASRAHISDQLVSDLLTFEHSSGVAAVDAARLFPDYLAAVEQLAHAVDTWRTHR
jgi:hypothetical protein